MAIALNKAMIPGIWAFLLLPCLCVAADLEANARVGAHEMQGAVSDEQRRFLDIRRRQIELASARAALQRQQELSRDGLTSRIELDRARTAVEAAQLNYQEAVLSFLAVQPRLTVKRAIKHQGRDGRKFVSLAIENLTPTFDDSQFKLLSNFDGADPIPESLRTRDVRDIYVSLRAAGEAAEPVARGTTIALPY
jgi:multidrug efflux pump subunit AcrA (membrane-fusion protein)